MEIQRHPRTDHLELIFEGRLDGYWAQHLSTSVDEIMREGTHAVRVNLSKTTYISSAGIGTLVQLYKNFMAVSGSFMVIEPSGTVRQILEMVGLAPMLFGGAAPAADNAVKLQGPLRRESGGVLFEIHEQAPGGGMTCRLLGHPERLPSAGFGKSDTHEVPLADSRLALGLGAFGDEFDHCRDRFGEFLAVSGAGAFQPTDGTNFPDFMLSSGDFVPRLSALYGLCCDGAFSKLVRFESATASDPVAFSSIVENCLEIAESDAAAVVMLAESAGLMGAILKRSPVAKAATLFSYPEIRGWLSFSPERCFAHNLALIGGVASRAPDSALASFVRPLRSGSRVAGHFHAAAFGYRPLQKGALDLKSSVRGTFEAGGLEGVLHLLADDREASGTAESELLRGACWVSPIRQFHYGDANQ